MDCSGAAFKLGEWVHAFAASPLPLTSRERITDVLLDSIACAFGASRDENMAALLRVVRNFHAGSDCTVIGTDIRTSLPLAAFANAALIRVLDFNDTYYGPRQIGHPSDILGAALAAAELAGRSGEDLQRGIRLGYEVYGRLLDLTDPDSAWDHVSVCGISVAAMTGWLLGLSPTQVGNAIALAATHSPTLGEVRVGQVSSAKSIASAVVIETATLLTLLAAENMTGPPQALEGRRGYGRLLLGGANFSDFCAPSALDRIELAGLKPYPCFALGQGPISAAISLRGDLLLDEIDHVDIFLADTGPARLRLSDAHGRVPELREAADHSLYVLVALALRDGHVTMGQFSSGRWKDPEITSLIPKISIQIDPTLAPAKDLPCRISIKVKGRSPTAECRASPGTPANPLPREQIIEKFSRCAAGRLPSDESVQIVDLVSELNSLTTLQPLLGKLAARPPAGKPQDLDT